MRAATISTTTWRQAHKTFLERCARLQPKAPLIRGAFFFYFICILICMDRAFFKDVIGWGVMLWVVGYILGFIFFALVPPALLGWVIMPIGALITLWVLLTKIRSNSFARYIYIAVGWTLVAVVFDYLFLVMLLKPADGYYKLDVYVYYALTFILPLAVGWYKSKKNKTADAQM
jgi:hypothetical protein